MNFLEEKEARDETFKQLKYKKLRDKKKSPPMPSNDINGEPVTKWVPLLKALGLIRSWASRLTC